MTNPFEVEEKAPQKPSTVRLTLDVQPEDAALMDAVAAFRNEMYRLKHGERRQRLLKRKNEAERIFASAASALRAQLEDMTAACGPLPDPKDRRAVERYCLRVMAWSGKNFSDK